MRAWARWLAGGLLLLSLGLPWTSASTTTTPGGPSCIPDLSGEGGLICDYIGVPTTHVIGGAVGGESPARFFLVLALVLLLVGWASARPMALLVAAGCAVVAVATALPEVLSGQFTALLAAGLLLVSVGGAGQRVRSLRSATWGETAGSSPSPSAR
ncbi:hypothetical protein FNH13_13630 [Ornithinimicrobium ciconiae]|uniref:Uncharacterized protein n=1 Tax=Ornithinimicrobium ciconiae TaxID=2594265 RepID=A0A516GCJ2_9MICO|nr:hypothetical protein [Ornithinimicrobium ciconiae]QDO89239.1 hypothetical protein FNH13_13630 [Ornithinimicrobium ciconiae]